MARLRFQLGEGEIKTLSQYLNGISGLDQLATSDCPFTEQDEFMAVLEQMAGQNR